MRADTEPRRPAWLSVPAAERAVARGPGWSGQAVPAGLLAPVIVGGRCPPVHALWFVGDHGIADGHSGAGPAPAVAPGQGGGACCWAGSGYGCCPLQSASRTETVLLGRAEVRCGAGRTLRLPSFGTGTADSRLGPAMDGHRLDLALSAGRQAVERARLAGAGWVLAGGAGRGAAVTDAAWTMVLERLDGRPAGAGPGPGAASAPGAVPARKAAKAALRRHGRSLGAALADPYRALGLLGGYEHAALTGAAVGAGQLGLGFVAQGRSARIALALAGALNATVTPWLGVLASRGQSGPSGVAGP